ncbi:hypothetical protein CK203_023885 [Vitis vinifera]|uniref:DUF659 domain-containing protein n=1 Tax=Vitis vinifera TaxID=29760 RepID=A0A438JA34_VITVI|nr:hypothetical protein CK203_023885 [Vitis vinifera]
MIYHSSVDTINIPKTVDYIFSLMDKVVKEVGEENVVQVVTDNEASFKAVGLPINEEGRETVHEDDGAINRRVSRHTSNATQERYVDSSCKGKTPRTISSSSSSDNGDNGGSRRGGGTSGGSRGVNGTGEGIGGDGSTRGGYVSQVDPDMSWAQGGENYYATQDTNHGYRPEIWEQRKHLERLTTFPSDDD